MLSSQQQVELQSQSFIFNSTRVSGQTNVLLISSLLLLKRGRAMRVESWATGRKEDGGGGGGAKLVSFQGNNFTTQKACLIYQKQQHKILPVSATKKKMLFTVHHRHLRSKSI